MQARSLSHKVSDKTDLRNASARNPGYGLRTDTAHSPVGNEGEEVRKGSPKARQRP